MHLVSIKQATKDILTMTWSDGHTSPFNTHYLREHCPCAGCKGETVLFQTYIPEKKPPLPGHSEIKSVAPVGNYAIKILWGDGHDTGLYTYQYLREICNCTECEKK